MKPIVSVLVLTLAAAPVAAQTVSTAPSMAHANAAHLPKYRITVEADKRTDFSKIRTYAWYPTHPSDIPDIDERVVAAVDRELAALGMTKVPLESSQVHVTYLSMNRTDVSLKAKRVVGGKNGDSWPDYSVGTIVVSLLDPKTLDPVLKIRADRKIVADANLAPAIDSTVAEMFRKYPTRVQ